MKECKKKLAEKTMQNEAMLKTKLWNRHKIKTKNAKQNDFRQNAKRQKDAK